MVLNAENRLLAMCPVQCTVSQVTGQLIDWFSDYLKDRSQRVAIDGIAFERLPATSGVPQAVLLAHTSLWYLSMTLLVPSSRWQTSTALNADDTKLCRTILTMEDWYLESSLNQIRSRSNTSECKVLTVTRKKTPVTHDYLLGDVNLQRIQEAIYGSWRYYF